VNLVGSPLGEAVRVGANRPGRATVAEPPRPDRSTSVANPIIYLYTGDQLRAWLPRIRSLSESAREVYVFTNNHHQGKAPANAPANALQLRALLEDRQVEIPPALIDHFPTLKTIAILPDDPFSGTLF